MGNDPVVVDQLLEIQTHVNRTVHDVYATQEGQAPAHPKAKRKGAPILRLGHKGIRPWSAAIQTHITDFADRYVNDPQFLDEFHDLQAHITRTLQGALVHATQGKPPSRPPRSRRP